MILKTAFSQARILALNEQGIAPKLFIVGRKGVQALTTRLQTDCGMGMGKWSDFLRIFPGHEQKQCFCLHHEQLHWYQGEVLMQ